MLRKLLGTVLIVLGLVAAGLGVASATVWRQSDTVVATAAPQGDGALVVTDPGVLELVDDSVTVRATAPGDAKVTLAVGRDVDVAGWVGDEPYTRVTGLSDWETLATAAGAPSPSADGQDAAATAQADPSGADPAGNDMWVAQASGEGTVTLRWSDQPGRWSLLAAGVGDGAEAPTVELTWPRAVTTPWLWPGVIAGAVLVLAGLAVLLVRRRRGGQGAVDRSDEVVPPSDASPAGAAGRAQDGAQDGAPGGAPGGARDRSDERPAGRAEPGTEERPVDRADPRAAAPAAGGSGADPTDGTDDADPTDDADGSDGGATGERERRGMPFVGRRSRRPSDRATTVEPTAAPAWPATTGAAPWPARPGPDAAPEPAKAEPQAATAATPAVVEPPTTTGATRMTRRELRALEEEARRSSARPITGRLRALTGQIPVVGRGQQPGAEQDAAGDGPAAASRAGRAAAWRATWGFDGGAPRPAAPQDAAQDGDAPAADTHDSTEGGSR